MTIMDNAKVYFNFSISLHQNNILFSFVEVITLLLILIICLFHLENPTWVPLIRKSLFEIPWLEGE